MQNNVMEPKKRRKKPDKPKPIGYRMGVKIHPSLEEPLTILAEMQLADNSEMVKVALIAYLKSVGMWPWTPEVRERFKKSIQETEADEPESE